MKQQENIIFSEISHTQKDKFHVLFLTAETTCKLDIHVNMCVCVKPESRKNIIRDWGKNGEQERVMEYMS